MGATATTQSLRQRRLLWLVGGVSVGGTVMAGAFTGFALPIAMAIGVLVALGTVGWSLWRNAPDPQQAKSNLGTGLLVSIVVAAAVGSAQFAIDDRRRDIERQRQEAAQRLATWQNLRITVGLQKSLVGIDLSDRDLTAFYLANKNLGAARLEQAVLEKANLERANLEDAELRGANLRGARLFEATLRGASLRGADLSYAIANGANLSVADLRGAHLRKTALQTACLRRAFLAGADLRRADLRAADLRGADLRGADLRGANLHGVTANSRTRWPAGFDRNDGEAGFGVAACSARGVSQR
jgi:uncharacterized protein YjbI with pentapeptide repeats